MSSPLISIDDLPRQNASQVKNKWGEVVRQVRQSGSVAITNHSSVEMVLLDAATYQQLTESLAALQAREQSVLDELAERFDARLPSLPLDSKSDPTRAAAPGCCRLASRASKRSASSSSTDCSRACSAARLSVSCW